jgi:hypothetical protein
MKRSVLRCALAAAAALVPATLATPVHARQDTGWSFTGKVTAVFTGGNSEASTFGLASSLRFRNETCQFRFETGAVRTDSGIKERRAVGSDSVFVVEEETIWEKTAEAYYARGAPPLR